MAYDSTKKGNNSAPRTTSGGTITFYACLDYTITTSATRVTLKWRARMESTGRPSTKGNITGTGQTKVSFSTKTPSSSGDGLTMGSGTWSWDRGTSAASKTVKLTLGPTATATDYEDALSTATITFSVPALASYAIAYNANGGSGSMSSQTKYYGKTLTLRANSFTRTGYTFQKFNTASGGTGTDYASGGSYTANAAATMYAVWKANTYTVSFDANGGSGAPASQTKTYGQNLTLTTAKPTRTNYVFKEWNSAANGSGVSYASGGTFSTAITENTTLYAQWYAPYTVSYDANGGAGAPASQTKVHGVNLTLSTARPTRAGWTFAGWSTSASASSVTYAPGATYSANSAATLHAIWKPIITATLTLSERCSDAACTVEDESGAYVEASVTWSCPVSVTASSLSVDQDSGLTIGAYSFSAGTTGSYSAVISGFDVETSYPIAAAFSTGSGSGYMAGSLSIVKVSPGAMHMLDFKGRTNIGILGPADDSGGNGLVLHASVAELRNAGGDGTNSYWSAKNLATGVSIGMGVGSGGTNHGLWSYVLNKWLIYGSASSVFVNGVDMSKVVTSTVDDILSAGQYVTIAEASYVQWGKVATVRVKLSYSSAIASGNIDNITLGTMALGKRPAIASPIGLVSTGPVVQGYITTGGNIILSATAGAISANSNFEIGGTYVLA